MLHKTLTNTCIAYPTIDSYSCRLPTILMTRMLSTVDLITNCSSECNENENFITFHAFERWKLLISSKIRPIMNCNALRLQFQAYPIMSLIFCGTDEKKVLLLI